MIQFYAQPYDMEAKGFYFADGEEFDQQVSKARNAFGDPVEEFEIQFIEGDLIDLALFDALQVNQATIAAFCEFVGQWDDHDKLVLICAVGECGYSFEFGSDTPDSFDVDIYANATLRELAEQFVDEGLFGDIPERLSYYLDYDAIARDLSADYTQTTIAGERYVYRCA